MCPSQSSVRPSIEIYISGDGSLLFFAPALEKDFSLPLSFPRKGGWTDGMSPFKDRVTTLFSVFDQGRRETLRAEGKSIFSDGRYFFHFLTLRLCRMRTH